MDNIFFSVIVPAFCAEKTMGECLESVLNTADAPLEVVVVDDGSTDTTADIVKGYIGMDARVRLIQKENGGLSSARNAGMKAAKGQYLVFVDSDDCLVPGALDTIWELVKDIKPDIIVGDVYFESRKRKKIAVLDATAAGREFSSEAFLARQLTEGKFWTPVWFNIYKTDFIRNHDLCFRQGIYLEDDEWTIRAFLSSRKIYYSGVCLYRYIIRDNSIMRKKDCTKHVKDGMDIYTCMRKRYEKDENEGLVRILNGWIAERFLVLYSTWPREFWKLGIVLDKKWILQHVIRRKVRWKAYLYSVSPRLLGWMCLFKHACLK